MRGYKMVEKLKGQGILLRYGVDIVEVNSPRSEFSPG